jgi:hypothetical protein
MRVEGRRRLVLSAALALLPSIASPANGQEFRGRITGIVTDTGQGVLPGVTVTATSPALIQPQVTQTGEDGAYRFVGLPAGVYELRFELPGFQVVRRENIRVVINTALTVNTEMAVGALQEALTVTGGSPVVDTSRTVVGTNFTKELLTEIPNARDIWAAMAQAPGFHMTGYDVGGSHTGTQTGFITYGLSQQRTTRIEGINTTEGASANAGYFDFGSFEEFQLGAAGNMADQDVPGASLNITVKSGGDRFTGMWYSDWQGDRKPFGVQLIGDNVPDVFRVTGQRDDDGFFRASTPLRRGNQIDRQYDLNGHIGGPIKKGRAWFFYSYRLNDQYKYILGFDDLAQSKLTNPYTVKATYQLSRGNQIIGYLNKREKLQALRELGANVPLSASWFQASRNYPMKLEWTSVLGSRAFLDVIAAQWYNFFPLRPQAEAGNFPAAQFVPGRMELTTGQFFDGGANNYYQDQKRFKPQFGATLSYYQDQWGRGTHDLKFGYEWKRDRRKLLNDQPFNIFYRDRNGNPSEVDLYNTTVEGINDVELHSLYAQDSWKFSPRLTINAGLRVDRYRDGWPDQSHTPEGIPALQGATDPVLVSFFAPRSIKARDVSQTTTIGPRIGFAYDPGGNGKSVIKGYYGRFYFNSADIIADNENPVGAAQLRYQFNDLNGNRILDGPQELGRLLTTVGGAGFVTVDPNLKRPYGEEISAHVERELREGLSGRVSYVYKNVRDDWAEVDLDRVNAYTIPVTRTDPGPDAAVGTSDDRTLSLVDRPAGVTSRRVFTNPDEYDSDYHTVEFAAQRRFSGGWMLLTAFEHTWLKQFNGTASSTSELGAAGVGKAYLWRPNQRMFGRESTTLWNYKLVGRYTLPWDFGVSGSYKLQSGLQWGRTLNVSLPGAGSETIRVEPANSNRAPNVHIVDLRFDRSFRFADRVRATGMIDVFNLLNLGTVTTFRTATAANFKEVTSLLGPRIIRFGFRVEF